MCSILCTIHISVCTKLTCSIGSKKSKLLALLAHPRGEIINSSRCPRYTSGKQTAFSDCVVNLTIYPTGHCTACAWATDPYKCVAAFAAPSSFAQPLEDELSQDEIDLFSKGLSSVFGEASSSLQAYIETGQDRLLAYLPEEIRQLKDRIGTAKALSSTRSSINAQELALSTLEDRYKQVSQLKESQKKFILQWNKVHEFSSENYRLRERVKELESMVCYLKGE